MSIHASKKPQIKNRSVASHAPIDKKVSQVRGSEINSKASSVTQLQSLADTFTSDSKPIQKRENNTGLPGHLKSGVENLSGYAMDDVKVHYNSDKPAQLNAHAYAQGTNIHLAPGQEKHLPHEAWHVVQQKQGRVKPTTQLKGKVHINDDQQLEKEADVMGLKADSIQLKLISESTNFLNSHQQSNTGASRMKYHMSPIKGTVTQRMKGLVAPDEVYVHTTIGPIKGQILAALDAGEAYRVKLTGYHNKIYEVSHFIVDTDLLHLPSNTKLAKPIEADAVYEVSIKEKILKELNSLISAKEEKISVMERMKQADDDTVVSAEDDAIMQKDESEVSGEVTAMMLEVSSLKTDGAISPFIVNDSSFKAFLLDLQKAVKMEVEHVARVKKLHLIFLGDGHYTPVIIQIGSNGKLQVFSVDASGTPKNFGKLQAIADASFGEVEKDVRFYSDGDVQMDSYHCETFSIDDLHKMASMTTAELIKGIPEMHLPDITGPGADDVVYHQEIEDIDPRFMHNSQSRTKTNLYKEKRDKGDPHLAAMDKHIDDHSILFKTGAKKNRSIDYSRYQKLLEVRKLLSQSSLQQVEHILDKRIYNYRDMIEPK
ncbi:MAG: DUF4157 domain-containing protein [Reichenbachiella sp.]|uniref:eCIS core domain-containing protein n=1 Tax=Reichenbachiella sp. TaxID=2184521 RepID=UPI003266C40E